MNFLFLRGLTRDQRHWDGFAESLPACYGPDAVSRFIDLPGTGTRAHLCSPITVEGIAAQVLTELGDGPSKPNHLVAMSLGAMVVLSKIETFLSLFDSITLINTSDRGRSTLAERFNLKVGLKTVLPLLRFSPVLIEETILQATSRKALQSKAHYDSELQKRVKWFKECPFTRQTFLRQAAAGARFSAGKKISAPARVQFLASQGDQLVSWRCSERLAHDYGSTFKVHPSAGHDLPLDDPEWTREMIVSFIRNIKTQVP